MVGPHILPKKPQVKLVQMCQVNWRGNHRDKPLVSAKSLVGVDESPLVAKSQEVGEFPPIAESLEMGESPLGVESL